VAANVAADAATNSNTAASQLSVTTDGTAPTVALTGPTEVVTTDFRMTFAFSEPVTGLTADDVTVVNGTKGALTGSGTTYTLAITPELGTTVSVSVPANSAVDSAGNGNEASNTFEVSAGSPASEFEAAKPEVTQAITASAERTLNSAIVSNTRLVRDARSRFLASRQQMQGDTAGIASRNTVAFDVDGTAEFTGLTLSTKGTFFGQTGDFEGTKRRLVFGDFNLQRDSETGSNTATLSGKIAWEQMLSEQTMLGYYIGGELGRSQIEGSFTGDQDQLGVSAGGYVVHALQENLFVDGFVSLGIGQNDLEMSNATLDLESDYGTKTATVGAALTGVIEQDGYNLLPELSFTYGKTFLGDVAFTGRAYGLVDNTLSLDAGDVSTATLMFRPEFSFALDGQEVSTSLSTLSFAPRLICEQRKVGAKTSDNCGGGAELGMISSTADGLSSATIKLLADRVGNSTRSGLQLQFEHKF
ncbi:Ig-like domain-containing protein, partial [Planktotalea arctica]|uniref:Ig-like domain-containing protein n=1 Tax=Planktotalea arctica TaxID=1481893 RepID=UPI00321B7E75